MEYHMDNTTKRGKWFCFFINDQDSFGSDFSIDCSSYSIWCLNPAVDESRKKYKFIACRRSARRRFQCANNIEVCRPRKYCNVRVGVYDIENL